MLKASARLTTIKKKNLITESVRGEESGSQPQAVQRGGFAIAALSFRVCSFVFVACACIGARERSERATVRRSRTVGFAADLYSQAHATSVHLRASLLFYAFLFNKQIYLIINCKFIKNETKINYKKIGFLHDFLNIS